MNCMLFAFFCDTRTIAEHREANTKRNNGKKR